MWTRALVSAAVIVALRPRRSAADRIRRELKPHRRKLRKKAKRARKELGGSAGATAELAEELVAAGRTILHEFRIELAELMEAARIELSRAADRAAKEARRTGRTAMDRVARS